MCSYGEGWNGDCRIVQSIAALDEVHVLHLGQFSRPRRPKVNVEKGTLRATIVNGEMKGHGRAVLTNTGAETFSGCTGIRKRQSAHTKKVDPRACKRGYCGHDGKDVGVFGNNRPV